ncbi:MAG: UvrD-helicase domain-containing protein, partial [Clostridia bacterium]|nr:UvrD-helicase domain-containing protein [Clostridia bacterium]
MNFTPAQKKAVQYPDGNLLLSAAAGSGKTATLTGRILYLLETEQARLSEMLIVTYTRAAAAELRGRIGTKITEAAKTSGNRKMARHLTDLPGAQISTIHAFLYRTLRPSFSALGLSPDFTIGDEAIIEAQRTEAMRDTLDDFYAGKAGDPAENEAFIRLADALAGSRDAEALDKTLLSIYARLIAAGETPDALNRYAALLETDEGFFAMPQSQPIRDRLHLALSHYSTVISDLRRCFDEITEEKYGPAADWLTDWIQSAEQALASGRYDSVRAVMTSYAPPRLATLSARYVTDISENFKAVRDALKKDIVRFTDSFFADPAELAEQSLHRTAALLRTAAVVLDAYEKAFRARKMSRSLLDYNDLETLALRLFIAPDGTPTDAARETGRRFRYIFVDEYQDTNRVQDAIFRALSSECPRFMVGDSKQSIYRFRGAEPSVFARYRDRWPTVTPDAEDCTDMPETAASFAPDEGRCLFMSENFRCDSTVVDFVNLVSDFLFPSSAMPYAPEDALVFAKGESGNIPAEIVIVEDTPDPENEDRDPEAEYVADRIAAMLTDPQAEKPLTPDKIAILLRSPDTNGSAFRDALIRRGIPVRLPGGEYLFSSPAVLLVMCLLYTADNPLCDIPAAGAMHSPLFGFATHELVKLRAWSRKTLAARYGWEGDMPLFCIVQMAADPDWIFSPTEEEPAPAEEPVPEPDELQIAMDALITESPWAENPWTEEDTVPVPEEDTAADPEEPLPEALLEKCRIFHAAVTELRDMACGMRADRFLDELFRRYALFDLPEIRENPMEKTNLQTLYDMARRFESGSFGGVGGFLTYTKELQKQKQEGAEEAFPAVTILSIHKSKGLEFPVVFVSACSKGRNNRDEVGDILFDPDLGFGMRLPDTGGYARCGTALRSAIAEKKRLESVEEEMRVVYVALTRARNRLIVTGKENDPEAFLEECRFAAEFASPYSITGSCTYLEWILTAAIAHGPDPCWKLTLADLQTDAETDAIPLPEAEAVPEDWDARLSGNLDFVYPWAYLAKIPAKLTVSRLSPEILDGDEAPLQLTLDSTGTDTDADTAPEEIPLPAFMTENPASLSAAQRGTATHQFLQFADFAALAENGVEAELARLTEHHFLPESAAAGVYITQLERFRRSDLFRRICASPFVHREFRFNAPMDAWKFTEDPTLAGVLQHDGVRLIVQGVVDCVFRDEDGTLTLVDYKTDRPTAEEYKNPPMADERFLARHRLQLSYYREICAAMFGEEIRRTVI